MYSAQPKPNSVSNIEIDFRLTVGYCIAISHFSYTVATTGVSGVIEILNHDGGSDCSH